jgi:hypothetical protein
MTSFALGLLMQTLGSRLALHASAQVPWVMRVLPGVYFVTLDSDEPSEYSSKVYAQHIVLDGF